MADEILILGIETSCDETAAALLGGRRLLSHVVASQTATHARFGGVVPEIASREHCLRLGPVVAEVLAEAGAGFADLSAIAVTYGPGLVGSLLVGVAGAKAMAFAAGKPLIAVNHLEAHVYANFLEHPEPEFPLLALLISGGHTHLILMRGHLDYQVLGRTRDDAAGEAFDKVARALGLGYPGGPLLERAAREGDPAAFDFPRAMLEPGSLDFSFSGLKSAVLNTLNSARQRGEAIRVPDVAASFQQAVADILARKTAAALKASGARTLVLGGGVAANQVLRERLRAETRVLGARFVCPSPLYCTDNGAMVALCGHYRYLAASFADWRLNAVPGLSLQDFYKKSGKTQLEFAG
ncbi:MAG: tRNA (adenosine(37)-N6)-threonylcarbamoyltransferase complex transferase subunit TsaD [Gracilibacteraceae bacterium]|jgi:N6-L-threonylcarbamoyladenine synthase|nr:tRNA (adenosine(37)-N6)-threonylcarbamoyltransferase complex transferase subunit TsaD [Gracilibacteraceae bacterium]